jgi:hypothetical protein
VLAISGSVLVLVVAVVVVVVVTGGSPKKKAAATTPASLVIGPTEAKTLGFAVTVQKAKETAVTDQAGCTGSVEALYSDPAKKTGLASDVLICKSTAAASAAIAKARKRVTPDSGLPVPPGLGAEAFTTASNAPEYLVAWRAGTRVAITAIDLDITATSTSTSTPPFTSAEAATLREAALRQNSLY